MAVLKVWPVCTDEKDWTEQHQTDVREEGSLVTFVTVMTSHASKNEK